MAVGISLSCSPSTTQPVGVNSSVHSGRFGGDAQGRLSSIWMLGIPGLTAHEIVKRRTHADALRKMLRQRQMPARREKPQAGGRFERGRGNGLRTITASFFLSASARRPDEQTAVGQIPSRLAASAQRILAAANRRRCRGPVCNCHRRFWEARFRRRPPRQRQALRRRRSRRVRAASGISSKRSGRGGRWRWRTTTPVSERQAVSSVPTTAENWARWPATTFSNCSAILLACACLSSAKPGV